MKKATIVLGSPHAKGNTARLVEAVVSAIDKRRVSVTKIELSGLKRINHCTGCDSCKKNAMHQCVFDDGLNEVIAGVRQSDVLVIASPIYFFNFNSLTKAFIDRLFYSSELSNGDNLLRGKKAAVVLTYGLAGVIESGAKNALQSFYDMSRFVGLELLGMVYGSMGGTGRDDLLLGQARRLGKTITTVR